MPSGGTNGNTFACAGADVTEAGLAQRSFDVLGVVLVEQPQQEPDQRAGGEVCFHGLTAEGEALHRSLREYIAGSTALLLGQFPADDIATTVRTLQAITERAAEALVVAS